MSGKCILYISYDGLLEPLGQSQVYQYLKELHNSKGHQFALLSFEKKEDWQDQKRVQVLKRTLLDDGIEWFPLKYHRKPSLIATTYDILKGIITGYSIIKSKKINIIHSRSYVSSVIGHFLSQKFSVPHVFDMRGFWADEKVDSKSWPPSSMIYKLAKWFEKRFLLNSKAIVSLTHSGVEEIKKFSYMHDKSSDDFYVIPTCANLNLFSPSPKKDHHLYRVGYVGTTTNWYAFEPVLLFYKLIKEVFKDSHLVILNKGEHKKIQNDLKKMKLNTEDIILKSVNHQDVAREMSQFDITAFFIHPTFSKKASAPTKLGEFLACGVPCVTSAGVGDMDRIIRDNQAGLVIEDFSPKHIEKSIEPTLKMLEDPLIGERCRSTAEKYFSLASGVETYDKIYQNI